MDLIKKLTGKNQKDYEQAAAHIVDGADVKSFKELVDGRKITYGSSAKQLDGYSESFAIKAGKETIVTVYLKKNEKASGFGIKGYKIAALDLDDKLLKTYDFVIPSDVKLIINGTEIKDKDRTNLEMAKVLTEKIGDGDFVCNQTFSISLISKDFDVNAVAYNGKVVEIVESDGVYTVEQYIDEDELAAFTKHALEASQGYAKFMQEDATLGSISHYFDTSTEFYNYVRKNELWVWEHQGYSFEDVITSECHKYTDTLYSCRITFTQVLKRGSAVYKDYFDKYVYIEKTANGLKVLDMPNVSK